MRATPRFPRRPRRTAASSVSRQTRPGNPELVKGLRMQAIGAAENSTRPAREQHAASAGCLDRALAAERFCHAGTLAQHGRSVPETTRLVDGATPAETLRPRVLCASRVMLPALQRLGRRARHAGLVRRALGIGQAGWDTYVVGEPAGSPVPGAPVRDRDHRDVAGVRHRARDRRDAPLGAAARRPRSSRCSVPISGSSPAARPAPSPRRVSSESRPRTRSARRPA